MKSIEITRHMGQSSGPSIPVWQGLDRRLLGELSRRIKGLIRVIGQRRERRRAYRQLAIMDDWQLKDIGLSRSDIRAAVEGSFDRSY